MGANLQEQNRFRIALDQAQGVLASLEPLQSQLAVAAQWCIESLASQNKIIACGNGGSACEAQHLVGELMGRYKQNRHPMAAIALNADNVVLTCIGNDFSFDDIFARQLRGIGRSGDIFIAFTTSGNSPNVLRAIEAARTSSIRSIAFLGRNGGAAAKLADCALIVPHADTARIQEGHNFLMHSLMDIIEAAGDTAQ